MYSEDNSLKTCCECDNNNLFTSSFKAMNKLFVAGGKKAKKEAIVCSSPPKEKPLEIRREEVLAIRNRFPTKIPVMVQKFPKETHLPNLDKSKFLVPQEITMSQFLTIIRNRVDLNSHQSLYLLVNNKSLMSLSLTLAEVYAEHANPDGFLYVTYASQEVFGNDSSPDSLNDYKNKKNCKQNNEFPYDASC